MIVITYLGLLTLAIIVVAGLIAVALGLTYVDSGDGALESMYQSLLRMLDPGTFSGDSDWSLRALTLAVTLIGIILGGSLIGLIANGVDQRVESLQRGHGQIVESEHSLVLGWSPRVPQIIAEIALANESRRRAAVVVLTTTDRHDVEAAIRQQVVDLRNTRVIIRNGDPSLPSDLERVCAPEARSIVAVRGDDGDAGVVKAVLAVRALDSMHARSHVVAEIDDDDDARTLRTVSRGRVVTVSSDSIVAEVTAQACRQSGLAAIFGEMLNFDGEEMYFKNVPELCGRTYAEAQLAFESSCVIGLLTQDGETRLNPPPTAVLEAEDRVIVVARDDAAVVYTGIETVDLPAVAIPERTTPQPLRLLVVGWSAFGARVLEELDEFLPSGSSIHLQVDEDLVPLGDLSGLRLLQASLTAAGGRGGPEDFLALSEHHFDQIVLLAYRDALKPSDADARTLLSLLALRMIWPVDAPQHVRVVAELVDQRNVAIASPAGIDDLIVSDALTSMMMAQLMERAELLPVFEELFRPTGGVVLLLSAEELLQVTPTSFAKVVAAASRRGASAFGYRVAATGKVILNPAKSAVVSLSPNDQIICIGPGRQSQQKPTRTQCNSHSARMATSSSVQV